MIRARGLHYRIGAATLLDDVSLALVPGELLAIVGPNGAGKSTLLATLAGDLAPTRGWVTYDDHDVRALAITELARRRAVLLQRAELVLAFTAIEVVQLAGPRIARELALSCLDEVGMTRFAGHSYPTLSGGEQQRVQLARVLAQLAIAPGCALLLDEPTSALDPRHQRTVLEIARRVCDAGHPTAVVLHDLTLAARWSDRAILLAGGRTIAEGSTREVLDPSLLERAYATRFDRVETTGGAVIVAV